MFSDRHVSSTVHVGNVSVWIVGNFYSLLGDHDKAVVYFKRAVRLNKKDHTAWILLGHEYLELKNHSMAIEAYTRALGELFTCYVL